MKKIKVGRRFIQLIVKGKEAEELDLRLIEQIAQCYKKTFNESWGENWTDKTAMDEIIKSFRSEKSREFIGTILLCKNEVVGFSWGVLAQKSAISVEKDLPFTSPLPEKEKGLKTLFLWLKTLEKKPKEKIFILREIGALKSVRGRLAASLAFHLLKAGAEGGANNLFLWTSPKSAAFKLSIGLLWRPIFFFENGCLIMAGSLRYSRDLAKKGLSCNPIRVWLGYRELKRNVKNFFN